MKEFSLSAPLQRELASASPGLKVAVYRAGREAVRFSWGDVKTYYDWASVTKVVFTVTAVMRAVDLKKISVDDPVGRYLSWFPSEKVTVKMLLGHYSGFEWWAPIYEMLRERNLVGYEHRPENWYFVRDLLAGRKIVDTDKATYSDLDFWTLGFLIEELYQRSLLEVWEELQELLEIGRTHFCVGNTPLYERGQYAPTETCPWRKKTLQGEAHDDNTWALGGIAPHAGLFGPMEDLIRWALGLRSALRGERWVISPETARFFARRCGPGAWAHGFMMPDATNSSVGTVMSRKAVGHWGFTGTGIWYDADRDVIVATLANRVHPTRDNKKFNELRPLIHDEVFRFLGVN